MFSISGLLGADARTKHLRDLRRARRWARLWAVWAGTLTGAAAVAVPYAGLGLLDIGWAGAAGGAVTMAILRRQDYRQLAAAPVPVAVPLTLGQRLVPLLGPKWAPLVGRAHRVALPAGSPGVDAARRLTDAAAVLPSLLDRLGQHGGELPAEVETAYRALLDLGNRLGLVERTLTAARPEARPALLRARDDLVVQFADGVDAYESLTAAAAECVAAMARGGDTGVPEQLTVAADRLAGLSHGLNTLHDTNTAYGVPN